MSESSARGGDYSAQFGGAGRDTRGGRGTKPRTTVSNDDRARMAGAMIRDTARATGKKGFAKFLTGMLRGKLPKPEKPAAPKKSATPARSDDSNQILGVAILEAYKNFIRRDEAMKAKIVNPGTKTGAGERREPVKVGVDKVFRRPTKAAKKLDARLAKHFPEDSREMKQARINLGLVKGRSPKGGMQG